MIFLLIGRAESGPLGARTAGLLVDVTAGREGMVTLTRGAEGWVVILDLESGSLVDLEAVWADLGCFKIDRVVDGAVIFGTASTVDVEMTIFLRKSGSSRSSSATCINWGSSD